MSGRITSMVVDEHYRGRGIGSRLIAQAEQWFDAVGCVKLEVTSADSRLNAHRFYERHGFVRDGQRLSKAHHHAREAAARIQLSRTHSE
ncbi:GNAT family N-acetyltransferase [Trinickia diaoshuihuensis]|uniref:GNAT family N-acetyltransferase n=1 Tax=Trinickia diaoshuihuensis TaxID=2292265 RepID=UPI000E23AE8B|nr:GNAT family N-acetyltransferase [Trinickia diaoshuihuensis]